MSFWAGRLQLSDQHVACGVGLQLRDGVRRIQKKETRHSEEERQAWEGKMALLADRLHSATLECKALAAQRDTQADLRQVVPHLDSLASLEVATQ